MNSITWPLSRLPSLLPKCTAPTLNTLPVVKYRCESWTIKKAEHWGIDAFNLWCWRLLSSLLDSKKLKSVNPKENQNCISIGRIHAEAPVLWPPDVKSRLTGKASDAGKDWGQEEKETTEDEMVGWHHRLDGHELEQTMGDSEGQGSLACCSLRGGKESDRTFVVQSDTEKEMATHSSILAWRIPGTGEPGGLPSMGSHRVGHDWCDLAAAAAAADTEKQSVTSGDT